MSPGFTFASISAGISNQLVSNVWDNVTYPLRNFNGCIFGLKIVVFDKVCFGFNYNYFLEMYREYKPVCNKNVRSFQVSTKSFLELACYLFDL